MGVFIVDGANTSQVISLTIIPTPEIPGQNLIVKLEDLRTVKPLAGGGSAEEQEINQPRSTDYVGNVRQIMAQAVRGKIRGFAAVPIEGGTAKMGAIEVTPEYAFTGSTVDVYRYSIKNASEEVVDLAETAFYRKGVKAVSFFPSISLQPGEAGYVFLLADKPKSAQAQSEVFE
jgi:conjugal transfer pilus assembly protein TraK